MIPLMHPCLIYVGSTSEGFIVTLKDKNLFASLNAEQRRIKTIQASADDNLVSFLIYDEQLPSQNIKTAP